MIIFAPQITVIVAQLVRVAVCGTAGRGFEPHQSPNFKSPFVAERTFFMLLHVYYHPIELVFEVL